MATQIDWREELDRAIHHQPARPATDYVASGRGAVRRRRLAQAVAGLAAMLVVAGLAWAAVPSGWTADGRAARGSSVASGGPSPTAAATASPDRKTLRRDATDRPLMSYRPPAQVAGGTLSLVPGAEVHERRDDVFPGSGTTSVALDVTLDDQRSWIVLQWDTDEDGSMMTFTLPGQEDGTFDDFVAETAALGGIRVEAPGAWEDDEPTDDLARRRTGQGQGLGLR